MTSGGNKFVAIPRKSAGQIIYKKRNAIAVFHERRERRSGALQTAYVIMSRGVQFHLYADDTQLRLAMSSDNTSDGLVYTCRVYC